MSASVKLNRSSVDFTDGALFGNDAGEDEIPDVLNSYFVDQPDFKNFLSRSNAFQVARSRKGMGKSALISKLAFDLRQEKNPPVVLAVTGAALLATASPPAGASFLALQNFWTRIIYARINYAIAAQLGYSFSESAMALVDSAEVAAFKERYIVEALLQRIKDAKIPLEFRTSEPVDRDQILKRVEKSHGKRGVWLLVDDIDSTYVDSPEQHAITSTFFSACRALVRDVKGLSVRASVRSDVWSSLRKNEDLDKCEQYITDIVWSAADLKIILSKKVFSYFQRNAIEMDSSKVLDYRKDTDGILEYAFTPRMRWGSGSVAPFRPVYILSAGRPRWMSQLCRFAGIEAARRGKTLIGKPEIDAVMKNYSRFRLNDIYKEHSHQYSGLERLIETFSNSPSRYSTGDLLSQLAVNYINLVGANNIPELDGFPYKFPAQLAHFLYKIGFIVGRREQEGDFGNADFVRYEQRPELLSNASNLDDGLLWEVHPSYRNALNIGKERRAAAEAQKRSPNRKGRGTPRSIKAKTTRTR